ncbi:hypothetical protein GCM10027519_47250 [Kineococcus endophyticus]
MSCVTGDLPDAGARRDPTTRVGAFQRFGTQFGTSSQTLRNRVVQAGVKADEQSVTQLVLPPPAARRARTAPTC